MPILAKTFSRSDYNRCDGRAKAAGVALLRQRGHTDFDTQERMAYDILSTGPDGQPHHCEVEIKECWRGEWPAPWRSVHLPERRRRALTDEAERGQAYAAIPGDDSGDTLARLI